MCNIIKSLNYQNKRDIFIYILAFASILLLYGIPVLEGGLQFENGGLFVISISSMLFVIPLILTLGVTSRVCGFDYNDRTINYEILNGHSRGESYFARLIVSSVWSISLVYIITILPALTVTLIKGFGNNMYAGELLIKTLLTMLCVFRLVSLYSLLSVIVRNCYGTLVLGWVGSSATMVIELILADIVDSPMLKTVVRNVFSFGQLINVTDMENYMMKFVDGKEITFYKLAISGNDLAWTILTAMFAIILNVILGYVIVSRRDMNE